MPDRSGRARAGLEWLASVGVFEAGFDDDALQGIEDAVAAEHGVDETGAPLGGGAEFARAALLERDRAVRFDHGSTFGGYNSLTDLLDACRGIADGALDGMDVTESGDLSADGAVTIAVDVGEATIERAVGYGECLDLLEAVGDALPGERGFRLVTEGLVAYVTAAERVTLDRFLQDPRRRVPPAVVAD